MASLLNLKEIKEARGFVVDTLRNFKDEVKSIAEKISAKDILHADQSLFDPKALATSSLGPNIILSVGLPLIGVYLAKKKHGSHLARKIASFLGADVKSINEQIVFDKLKSEESQEYYNELGKNVLTVITERGDISPLTKMLRLTDGEAWDIFYTMKEIIFSAEVLNQFSIIVPSLQRIEKDVGETKNNLNSLLEILKGPIKVSREADNIATELRVHESTGIGYIHREEDSKLHEAIINNDNKIILIIGGPGSGKSKMLYNALMDCKEFFSTFMFIRSYFKEGDEMSLDLVLSRNDMDNFVIIWDDLFEKEPKFVSDIIKRINAISRSKNFRLIGASRKDISLREEGIDRVNLSKFDNIEELARECAKIFNVKLKPDVTADKIFNKGDGTPYYAISLFKMFKDREITLKNLDQLPSNVTDLWRNYLETTYHDSRLCVNPLNAFRSIGLLSHASKTRGIGKNRIREVYDRVFYGDLGGLDYALDDLVNNMFVSRLDVSSYYAHDSHIEALESKYPIEKHHVRDFTICESDGKNLWVFMGWAFYKKKLDYLDMVASRNIELNPNNADVWYARGLILDRVFGSYKEAIVHYDKAIELDPMFANAWNGKGNALYNLGANEGAIRCCDKAIELDPMLSNAWRNRGNILADLRKYEEAIKCYDRAIETDPDNSDALYKKGLALYKLGRYEEAIKYYEKDLEIDPDNSDAWSSKGNALQNLGRYEEANKHFSKAAEIDLDDAGDYINLMAYDRFSQKLY